ncbi:MAG: exodeoxyribonuclease III [Hyphomicrobiales bacterium]
MEIATWNINGIKARLDNLLEWLDDVKPDICCLQETKSRDEAFPVDAIGELGYNVAVHGQKSFNGVAVLSKLPFDEIENRLPGNSNDDQARYLETVISTRSGALRVASLYLPNGNPVDSAKFSYKLSWMDRLCAQAAANLRFEEKFILAGDYNIIPEADDARDPEAWQGDALFHAQSRAKFRRLLNLGFSDALRACTADAGCYTFWDYQAGAWRKNNGIRIDHILLSPQAGDGLKSCRIDKRTRGWDRPSDHVPVMIAIDG